VEAQPACTPRGFECEPEILRDVVVRRAHINDLPQIEAVVQRAYSVYVDRVGRRPAPMDDDYHEKVVADEVYVAEANGVVAGIVVLILARDHLLVESVAVDPNFQRRGIGRALMAHAERHAEEHDLDELRLYTNAAMTENLNLYPRLGYREDDRRTEDGFDRVFFSKRLTS
jgi:ribosomal protein S18 acetylase RimI-like enzyme